MKRLSFLPILAFVIAIVFSAFTNQSKQVTGQDPLWYYKLGDNTGVDEPSNYEPLDDQDEGCSEEVGVVCVIDAPDASGEPDLDNDVVISWKP